MLFISLEIVSVPGFVIAGFRKGDTRSNESASCCAASSRGSVANCEGCAAARGTLRSSAAATCSPLPRASAGFSS